MGVIEECFEKGVALKCEGDYEQAVSVLNVVIAQDPNHKKAHREIGLIYGFLGMFDESLQELLAALQLDPTDLTIRNDLALTYAMLGMVDEAKAEFEAVLVVDPGNDVALRNMIYF